MTLRVGILNDLASAPPSPSDIEVWLRRCVDELVAVGRIQSEVQFVQAYGLGLPHGTAAAVEQAFASLVEQGVALIVGPAIGDNALIATPLAERSCIPTINWAGTERARGEFMFHLQVGSHEDEAIVLARHAARLGARHIGVIYDSSPIGERYRHFLHSECELLNVRIATEAAIEPLATAADGQVLRVLEQHVDAVVYLGLGVSALAVAHALNANSWRVPRLMNTAGLRGYSSDYARAIDEWIYVDMRSDANRTLTEVRRRWDIPESKALAAAKGFDLGRLVAEGIARATDCTPAGIKEGLEKVKWLPAAEGHEGTLLGFGAFDRGALHGRYLVLRQWRDTVSVEC